MALTNLKHKQLSIQFSKEDGWALGKEYLNNYLKEHFDELQQHAMASKDIGNRKLTVVVLIVAAITIMISAMALAGAHLFAFILALIALADVGPILKFLDKSA